MRFARHLMFHLTAIALCLAATPLLANPPYLGVVTQDSVEVRAGAGQSYYVVGTLPKGTVVEVEEVFYDWSKIRPTRGMYSYVSRAWVDAQGDGSVGVINRNQTEIKAGAELGHEESYRTQQLLDKGDRVRIIGEERSFYKIEPPRDSYVYLPPDSVRQATAQESANAQTTRQDPAPAPDPDPDPTPTPDPAPDPAPAPDPSPIPDPPGPEPTPDPVPDPDPTPDPEPDPAPDPDPPTPPAPDPDPDPLPIPDPGPDPMQDDPADIRAALDEPSVPLTDDSPATQPTAAVTPPTATVDLAGMSADLEPVETPAVSEALRAVELEVLPLFRLPATDQPIGAMIAQYENVRDTAELPKSDRLIIERRLVALKRNQRVAEAMQRVQSARAEAKRVQDTSQDAPVSDVPGRYDAIGILTPSTVFNGQNLPRLYRLTDPSSRRTLAYVEPTPDLELADKLGQLLGVVGETHYDPALTLSVIRPRRVFQLQRAE